MNGYNDPRRPAYFTPQTQTAAGGYVGVRSGSAEIPEPTVPLTSLYDMGR